ncbi:hypothetical protein, partial [Propionicimonas sp.]|uniref:hypothetical protein n=1 Tax=Propionicimonas sp. TaxID=1955623 RepID=UPI0039E546A5
MTIDSSTRVRLGRPALAVWRAPGVLQVGLDDPAIVLEGVPRGLADAVPLLAHPCTAEELATLLPRLDPEWLPWLVQRLDTTGLLTTTAPLAEASVLVVGAGPLATAVAAAVGVGGRRPE